MWKTQERLRLRFDPKHLLDGSSLRLGGRTAAKPEDAGRPFPDFDRIVAREAFGGEPPDMRPLVGRQAFGQHRIAGFVQPIEQQVHAQSPNPALLYARGAPPSARFPT